MISNFSQAKLSIPFKRLYLLLTGLLFLGYSWLGFNIFGGMGNSFTPCPIKSITGYACPSCGTTRSIMAILEGNFYEAFFINPLGFIAIVALAVGPLLILVDLINRKSSLKSFYTKAEEQIKTKPLFLLFIIAIAANWIWNIYKGI